MKLILILISLSACSLVQPKTEVLFSATAENVAVSENYSGQVILTYKHPLCLVEAQQTKEIQIIAQTKPKNTGLMNLVAGIVGAVIEAVFSIID